MRFFFIFLFFSVGLQAQKLSLSECVSLAFKKNQGIQKKVYENNIQKINYEISKREFLPSITTNISNNIAFGVDQDVFGLTKRNDNLNSSALIGMQLMIYNGGKNRYNLLKSNFESEASTLDVESTKREISIEILKLYLQILLNKEIYDLASYTSQNAEKILKKAEITTKLGSTSNTVLYEAKANSSRELQRLQIASLDVKRSLFDLAIKLQIDDIESFNINNEFISEDLTHDHLQLSSLINSSIMKDPTIKALEFKLNSNKMQTEISKTPMKPSISMNANVGTLYFNSFVSENEDYFFKQTRLNLYQQLRLNISIPIFSKGISKLQVEKAKVNQDIVVNEINREKQELKNRIEKIFFEKQANYENFIQAKEVEQSTEASMKLVEKSYLEGFSTIYEHNATVENWLEAVSTSKQFKYKYWFNFKLLEIYSNDIDNINL